MIALMELISNASIPEQYTAASQKAVQYYVERHANTRNQAEVVTGAISFFVTFVITIAGNVAVMLAVAHYKPLYDNISNQFVLNLAITDLGNALLVVAWSALALAMDTGEPQGGEWIFGNIWCCIQCAANYCFIVSSMLTLSFVSIDRYAHVVYPLRYHDVMTPARMRCMIVWTWVQGCVIGAVPVACGWVHYDYYEVVCAVDWQSQHAVTYVAVAFVTCFIAPGATMLVCYTRILWEIRCSRSIVRLEGSKLALPRAVANACCSLAATATVSVEAELDSTSTTTGTQDQLAAVKPSVLLPRTKLGQKTTSSQQHKVVQSMLIVVGLFFLCMTPFCVTKLLKVLNCHVPSRLNTVATAIQYLSSAVNPLVYGMFRKDFRNAFHSMLRKLCRRMGFHAYADKMVVSPSGSSLPKVLNT